MKYWTRCGWTKPCTLLFSGFQTAGTRGRNLLESACKVQMFGQWLQIQAGMANLPMLSAHTDSNKLMGGQSGFVHPPVHPSACSSCTTKPQPPRRVRIGRELGRDAAVSHQDEVFENREPACFRKPARGAGTACPAHVHHLYAQHQTIVAMRSDGRACRAEGPAPNSRVLVRAGKHPGRPAAADRKRSVRQ